MAVAGGLAGLAGILLTYSLGAITPESGDTLLVKAFACIILGGVGSTAGVYAGVPPRGRRDRGPQTHQRLWVDAVSFGLIFLVLLVRPSGHLRPQGGATDMMDLVDSNLVLDPGDVHGLVLALSVQVPLRMGVFSFAGVGSYGIGAYLAGIITLRYETAAR